MPDLSEKHAEARRLDAAIKKLEERRAARGLGDGTTTKSLTRTRRATPDRSQVLGSQFDGRYVRKGENIMGSRGYEYSRVAAYLLGFIDEDQCKQELMTAKSLDDALRFDTGWKSSKGTQFIRKSVTSPLSMGLFNGMRSEDMRLDPQVAQEITQKTWHATSNFDPDEAVSMLTQKGGYAPDTAKAAVAQSWMQQAYGGALIPMPEMGPLIPLLRNQNAMLNAGATMIPLPPGGRIVWPRQTTASTVGHVGEGVAGTQTNVQTDQFLLSAKKLFGWILINNELIRYGGPAVEQLFRNDLIKSLSLQLDFDCLQGAGSDNVIAGLIGYPGVTNYATAVSPGGVATNGNTLYPGDIYQMRAQVFNANAETFDGFIIHPLLMGTIQAKRATVLSSGDNLGLFLWNITRGLDDKNTASNGGPKMADYLDGNKLTQSTNCPQNRVKGSGTSLTTLFGGQWPDYHIGMYGTIELALSDQGSPWFTQDQSAIRGILSADAGPFHPGVFVYYDQLLTNTVGQ